MTAAAPTDTLTIQEYHNDIPTFRYVIEQPDSGTLQKCIKDVKSQYKGNKETRYGELIESYHQGTLFQFMGRDTLLYNSGKRNNAFLESSTEDGPNFTQLLLAKKNRKAQKKLSRELRRLQKTRPVGERRWDGELRLDRPGVCHVEWYRHSAVTRKKEYISEELLPVLNAYLRGAYRDRTGRVATARHRFLKKEGTTLYYLGKLTELERHRCVEIHFPKGNSLDGVVITLGRCGKIYGLKNGLLEAPFLFYNDSYDTEILDRWLRDNETTSTGFRKFK